MRVPMILVAAFSVLSFALLLALGPMGLGPRRAAASDVRHEAPAAGGKKGSGNAGPELASAARERLPDILKKKIR